MSSNRVDNYTVFKVVLLSYELIRKERGAHTPSFLCEALEGGSFSFSEEYLRLDLCPTRKCFVKLSVFIKFRMAVTSMTFHLKTVGKMKEGNWLSF